MYYFCVFRCFTAASTSSSFCSVEQGSFWTFFSTCSDWNFASSCAAPALPAVTLGKPKILPSLPSFLECLLLHSMRDFWRICRHFTHYGFNSDTATLRLWRAGPWKFHPPAFIMAGPRVTEVSLSPWQVKAHTVAVRIYVLMDLTTVRWIAARGQRK